MVSRTVPRLAGYVYSPAACWNRCSHSPAVGVDVFNNPPFHASSDQLNETGRGKPVNYP